MELLKRLWELLRDAVSYVNHRPWQALRGLEEEAMRKGSGTLKPPHKTQSKATKPTTQKQRSTRMAMTDIESAALMRDADFRSRVQVAALTLATTIQNEPANTPAHNARLRWAQLCFTNSDGVAATITPSVVMHPATQDQGKDITQSTLLFAVQETAEKFY
jgi:hypothetical protein